MWQPPNNVTEDPDLHNRYPVFLDRPAAGAGLAKIMSEWEDCGAVVCAIPAGGVPVATALAAALRLSLDLLIVSKMTLPWNTEAGFGAVADDGAIEINQPMVNAMALDRNTIDKSIEATSKKVALRERRYRRLIDKRTLTGAAVILVDDGLASGFTLRVAIKSARAQGAGTIVAAVPTGHSGSVDSIAPLCDRLYCANVREGMCFAVAAAYATWSDVSESEVMQQLADWHRMKA